MSKFYRLKFPHGHSGQPGQAPDQVVELGRHVSEALLDMYRDKDIAVTECNEDGSPLEVPAAPGGNKGGAASGGNKTDVNSGGPPAPEGGNGPTPLEARAGKLAAMKWRDLCDLAYVRNISTQNKKREVVEADILAAEFPEFAEGKE